MYRGSKEPTVVQETEKWKRIIKLLFYFIFLLLSYSVSYRESLILIPKIKSYFSFVL